MTQKLITLTLNPAIDETITLHQLTPGAVHRANAVAFHAGGKGVNVASCLADWGLDVTATGLLGRDNTAVFEQLFTGKNIDDKFLRVPGETRTNIKLSHGGNTTDINLPGLNIDADTTRNIFNIITVAAIPGSLVLLAGSLPAGIDDQFYARLITALNNKQARVILDTSAAPLAAALNGTAMPYCIKPNRAELEQFAGHPLPDNADLAAQARGLIARGVGLVVISLGENGALFVTPTTTLHASLPAIHAASTVGAGDAMVAGIIAGLHAGDTVENIARLATAFAAGKLAQAGPNLPPTATIEHLKSNVKIVHGGMKS